MVRKSVLCFSSAWRPTCSTRSSGPCVLLGFVLFVAVGDMLFSTTIRTTDSRHDLLHEVAHNKSLEFSVRRRQAHVQAWRTQLLAEYGIAQNQSGAVSLWASQHLEAYMESDSPRRRGEWILLGNTSDLSPQYAPRLAAWGNRTFADVQVVGLFKSGTSQLYNILAFHPELRPYDPVAKERCSLHRQASMAEIMDGPVQLVRATQPNSPETHTARLEWQKTLFEFHEKWSQEIQDNVQQLGGVSNHTTSTARMVNGCISPTNVAINFEYLGQPDRVKFLLLLRDPADRLWSIWHYVPQPTLDTHPSVRYRSPELFHEIIVGDNKTKVAPTVVNLRRSMENLLNIVRWFGRDKVLVLKSEDMTPERIAQPQPNQKSFLDRLAEFVDISRDRFDPKIYTKRRNCVDARGSNMICGAAHQKGLYRDSGFRPMLNETRKIIYMQFWRQCHVWAKEFQVVYPECLAAFDNNNDPKL